MTPIEVSHTIDFAFILLYDLLVMPLDLLFFIWVSGESWDTCIYLLVQHISWDYMFKFNYYISFQFVQVW